MTNRNQLLTSVSRRRLRAWVWAHFAQRGRVACQCCGERLSRVSMTIDRIIPARHGGTYRRDNVRPACIACQVAEGVAARAEMRRAAT